MQALCFALQGSEAYPQVLKPTQAADQIGHAGYQPLGSPPRNSAQIFWRKHRYFARLGCGQHSARQRVLAAALQAGRCTPLHRLIGAGSRHKGHQTGLADGQGAGFVKGHGVGAVSQLQRLCVFDQNTFARRHAGAGHDGRRRRQAQSTGAGNHQHRHRAYQRHLQRLAHGQPAQERGQCNQQHHRYKHGCHLVDQPLNGRFGSLCVLHQIDDFGQHGVGPDRAHPNEHAAVAVDAATRERSARRLGHRQRLAGEHRFIELGAAFLQHAVYGHALAGQHDHAVTDQQLQHGHVGLFAVFQNHMRQRRPQRMQSANRGSGLALGARLQPFTQHHQRNDDRGGLEIQVRHAAGLSAPPQPHRQTPARTRANGHQQIHVAGTRLERMPAGPVKARAQHKLHRCGQAKLQPGRQHPMTPGQVRQHGQHQWRSQGQRQRNRRKAGPGRRLADVVHQVCFAHAVTRLSHGAPQQGRRGGGGGVTHASRLGGQVDGSL